MDSSRRPAMHRLRHLFFASWVAVIALAIHGDVVAFPQKGDSKDSLKDQPGGVRPKLTLRATPSVTMTPARVVLTGELAGGSDDYEDFYCPTVEWDWGDDTRSESTLDCEPYEASKSQIKRRYATEHIFRRPGMYKIYLHLKRKGKILTSATVTVQVRSGGPY